MFDSPDFRTIVDDLDALTKQWERKSEELNQALAAAGGTEECPEFTLTVAGMVQIHELNFTDRAPEASPVQLRDKLLNAYARLVSTANGNASAHIASILNAPDLATAMRRCIPEGLRDRAGVEDEPDVEPLVHKSEHQLPVEKLTSDQVLNWVDANIEPDDRPITEMLADIEGWDPIRGQDVEVDSYELEKELQQAVAQASTMGASVNGIEIEHSSKLITLRVNGSGQLLDITFRPGFRNATGTQLSDDFKQAYARACQQATQQMLEHLDQHGTAADDPSRASTEKLLRTVSDTLTPDTH